MPPEHHNPPPDLHISRADLEPRIRDHDSNLDTQARALFDKNNLPHYNKEALENAARTGAINVDDLTKLRNLLAQRNHIRLTGELPLEAQEAMGIFTIKDVLN